VALSQKLEPLLALAEDTSYFPADAYEERRGRFVLRGGALALLAVLAHLPGLPYPWLWTDVALVPGNALLHSPGGLAQFWIHPLLTGQAPLASTFLYFENFFFNGPFFYHLVTLLAHAASCLLLWVILRRLQAPGAWLAAAIFAVHPIEVQSVAWASRQGDVLACLLGLGSLLAFLRLNEIHPPVPADFTLEPPSKLRMRVVCIGLFVAAVMCQPSTFMLVAVFALILVWKRGSFQQDDILELTPFFVVAAIVVVTGLYFLWAMHIGGPAAGLMPLDRVLIGGRAACFYVASLICPAQLMFIYPRWHLSGDGWMAVFPTAVLAAIAGLWWARRWIGDGPLVAALCYLGLLLPHLPLVRSEWMAYSFVADQLQYLPGIPLIALLAAGIVQLCKLVRSLQWRLLLHLAVGTIIIGGFGTLSWLATLPYSTELHLWQSTLAAEPSSLIVRGILSQYYLKQGRLAKAADLFPERIVNAMQLQADRGGAEGAAVAAPMLAWGHVLEAQSRFGEAANIYQQILVIDPRNHEAAVRLALSYKAQGDTYNALASFRQAVMHYPNDETLQHDFGLALADSGRLDEAIDHYRQAIRLDPNFVAAHIDLSKALFAQGKFTESSVELKTAAALDPRSFDAFYSSGMMLLALRNYQDAERMFRAATQLRPDSADAFDHLGLALEAQGFYNEAIDSFITAVKLNPDFQEARDSLARTQQERNARQP
jgi:tetratricopeptide (TPR) repeat protein